MKRPSKKRTLSILGIIALLIAAGIVAFPVLRSLYKTVLYRREVRQMERVFPDTDPHFQETLIPLRRQVDQYNREIATIGQRRPADPFTHQQPSYDLSDYDIYDYVFGFITIERMGVTLPILLGANDFGFERGAVLLTESSFPVGGINTNALIAARRDAETPMFRDIEKLKVGDRIVIRNLFDILTYEVVETKVIAPDEVAELTIQPLRDLITLISEHPRGLHTQRYIVVCERVTR